MSLMVERILKIWPPIVESFLAFFGSGPVVAEAMFVNREEVPVRPIYRDPVSLHVS